MDDSMEQDLISDLPQSIIETILTKLPIRDAVKTSILSTKWRYKWTTITQLVFDDECVPPFHDKVNIENRLVNFVFRTIFLHPGEIHKFALTTSILQSCPPEIDQWLLYLSRKDLKELILEFTEGEWFRAPSCLFACHKLTRLELVRCELDPPPNFRGFLCLKTLNLQQVVVPQNDIENLISSCPLLENLTLSYFDGLELTISAPSLKYLILEGEFKDICLKNTPLLVAISVAMYMTDDIAEHFEQSLSCNFDKFFGGVPCLQRLIGHIYFTKYLSLGSERGTNSIVFHHLTYIDLYQVSFDDVHEVFVVLRLIVNSPNLEELHVLVNSEASYSSAATEISDSDLWVTHYPLDCTFNRLRTVRVTDVSGMPLEMGLIKFLLAHSPGLQVMTVVPSVYVTTDGRVTMLVTLLRYPRASPLAELVFCAE